METWSQLTPEKQNEVRVAYLFGHCKTLKLASARFSVTERSLQQASQDEGWFAQRRDILDRQVEEQKDVVGSAMSTTMTELVLAMLAGTQGLSETFAEARDEESREKMQMAWEQAERALGFYRKLMDAVGDPTLRRAPAEGQVTQVAGAGGNPIAIPPDAAEAAGQLAHIAVRALMAKFTNQQRADVAEPREVETTATPVPPQAPAGPPQAPPQAPQGDPNAHRRQLSVQRPGPHGEHPQ